MIQKYDTVLKTQYQLTIWSGKKPPKQLWRTGWTSLNNGTITGLKITPRYVESLNHGKRK